MPAQGLVIVLSAPSGAGKSTLCHRLMQGLQKLRYSISYTTRPRRAGEREGIDYFFVGEAAFKRLVRRNAFVEWACVHGHYYGTPKSHLKKLVRAGYDVILDIDVQGGENIKKLYPEAVLVFIMTPSLKVLEQRLRERGKDSEEVIRTRLANARRELACLRHYDYLVINDTLEKAAHEVQSIIEAEHRRISHLKVPEFK